jgi:hypothetical protein
VTQSAAEPAKGATILQTAKHSGGKREPLTYTLQVASSISCLSEDTLRRRAKEGRLQLRKVGGRTLVDAASLHRLLGLAEKEG